MGYIGKNGRTIERNLGMVLLEFSMFPVGKGESLSPYVARSLAIIEESGLDYRLTAMGTILEGEINDVLAVMQKCLDAMAEDCDRISCTAKLDYRKGHSARLDAKVKSVQEQLGRPLKSL
jgi:uncharacterized protein (TIGR00106 family)